MFDFFKLQHYQDGRWLDDFSRRVFATAAEVEALGRSCDVHRQWHADKFRIMPSSCTGSHPSGARPLPAPRRRAPAV